MLDQAQASVSLGVCLCANVPVGVSVCTNSTIRD